MTRLAWDSPGERIFETGVDRGVLYPRSGPGVPWNGLTELNEQPTGGTAKPRYYDGMKIANPTTPEEYAATLSAYTYPDEFELCDGTAEHGNGLSYTLQPRQPFSLSYRTRIGNDLMSTEYGYKIHLVYNLMAAPTARANTTMSNSSAPTVMSWALSAIPMIIPGRRPTPHLIIDSTKTSRGLMRYVEDLLYGTTTTAPKLPTPSQLARYFDDLKFFKIVENEQTGLAQLIQADEGDLSGYPDEGKYSRTSNSRLMPTGTPGFYDLEQ